MTKPWPPGISDGLTLPCGICREVPFFDYRIADAVWRQVAPPAHWLGVVCLPCLDKRGSAMGVDVTETLEEVQFTGVGKTVRLIPGGVHRYAV